MLRFVAWPLAVMSAGLAVLGCTEASSPLGTRGDPQLRASDLAIQAGDSQFALVGRPVPVRPAVRVVDDSGHGVQGVEVTFAVTSGGGTATGTTAVSDSAGIATVGSWTLGPALGENTMTATVSRDVTPIVFTAIALCDCWTEKAALNTPRWLAGSAVLGGKLYVVGGMDNVDRSLPIEAYDLVNDTWTARGSAPAQYKSAVAALNGELYLVMDGALQSYDPVTGRWTVHPAPPTLRSEMDVVAVDGRLYVLGGIDDRGIVSTVEAFDPATEIWTTVAPMPRGRHAMAVAAVNGIIYVIGGEGRGGPGTYVSEVLASVVAYDPRTDTWTERAPLPERVEFAAVGVVNGRIYVAGGTQYEWNGSTMDPTDVFTPYVYAYDPQRDRWSIASPMRTGRYDATAAELDGVLYVVGGIGQWGAMLGSVEALKP